MSNACSWEWEVGPRARAAVAAGRPAAVRPAPEAEIIPFPGSWSSPGREPLGRRATRRLRWGRVLAWATAATLVILLALPIRAIGG